MPPRSEDRDFGHPCGRRHPVLAAVSRGCPRARGRSPRVTHPCATGCQAEARHPVRLACVRRAASVRSEPGSNSQLEPPSPSGNGLFPAHGITAQGSPLGPTISRPPLPKEPPQRRPVRNPPQPPRPGSPPRAPQAPKKRPRAGTATRTPPRHLSGCLSPATQKGRRPRIPSCLLYLVQRTYRGPPLRSAALLCRQTTPYSHKAGGQQAPFCAYSRH
jgi:hypothetical protein